MSFATIVPTVADLADSFKYSLGGVLIGAVFAGASEAVGDWVADVAQVKDSALPVNRGASLVLRTTAATAFFLAGQRMFDTLGGASQDPAGGLFFQIAFILGQPRLVEALAGTAAVVTKQSKVYMGLSCCSDCAASGGACGK